MIPDNQRCAMINGAQHYANLCKLVRCYVQPWTSLHWNCANINGFDDRLDTMTFGLG